MRRIAIVAALSFAALLSVSVSTASACRGTSRAPARLTTEDARWAVTCLINKRRKAHGLHRVRPDVPLGIAAQGHSEAMASRDFFSHGGDGTPASRAAAAGYGDEVGPFAIGENLGWGSGLPASPRGMVHAWMSSPGHRSVILGRRYRQIGVGVAHGSPVGADTPDAAIYTVLLGCGKRH